MKKLALAVALLGLLVASGARAAIGHVDDVLAATELLPVFEVDTGPTFAITLASDTVATFDVAAPLSLEALAQSTFDLPESRAFKRRDATAQQFVEPTSSLSLPARAEHRPPRCRN